jgi:HlyD family secretion protein
MASALVLIFIVGGWSILTEFSGAVVASGQVVVDNNVKRVQHLTGGIVSELHAQDGRHVKAGQILVRLDDIQTRANLAIVTKALDDLAARQARLEAELEITDSIEFPQDLLKKIDNADVFKAVSGELRQFENRRATREGQKSQLKERVAQLNEEIAGYTAQYESKVNQITWISKELIGVQDLWKKTLIPYTRLASLEREKERLGGERGQLMGSIAQSRGKITETHLQILQIDQQMRAEVSREIAEIRGRTAELVEKKVSAEDQLQRIDIRSPQDGIVHQLSVHTVGGVISPGEQIMLIVPEADVLTIEVKVHPQDIDQVHIGQSGIVRLVAFNQQTTPELHGQVSRVSADAHEDKTGMRYYSVRVAVADTEISRLGALKLVPGMPADVFIQTSPRTVISFLVRPLWDQLRRAFRET